MNTTTARKLDGRWMERIIFFCIGGFCVDFCCRGRSCVLIVEFEFVLAGAVSRQNDSHTRYNGHHEVYPGGYKFLTLVWSELGGYKPSRQNFCYVKLVILQGGYKYWTLDWARQGGYKEIRGVYFVVVHCTSWLCSRPPPSTQNHSPEPIDTIGRIQHPMSIFQSAPISTDGASKWSLGWVPRGRVQSLIVWRWWQQARFRRYLLGRLAMVWSVWSTKKVVSYVGISM